MPRICSSPWENFRVFGVFPKTYFRELVLGFWPDRNQTSAARFSGVWLSIIIKKKCKFRFTVPKGRQNVRSGRSPFCLIGYNSWTERDFCTKLSTRMYELILWSREKGRSDWPLGGAITVKRVSKWCISMEKTHEMAESGHLAVWFAYKLTKSGMRMRHVILKKLENFHGRRAIGGALTVIKVRRPLYYPMQNDI